MEPDGETTQLWSPSTILLTHHRRSSHFRNPVVLILAIPILMLIIFLMLPSFSSTTNHQIPKPDSVQKGWDFLNIFLVLSAVLCGVFAKLNEEKKASNHTHEQQNLGAATKSAANVSEDGRKSVANPKWLDFPDKVTCDRMRSSSSYPDLKQESLWGSEGNVFKFSDDSELNYHRPSEKFYHRERRSQKMERAEEPKRAPQPLLLVKNRRSVHQSGFEDQIHENKSSTPPPPPAPSLSPLPPPPELKWRPELKSRLLHEKGEGNQQEKSGTRKEIAMAVASVHYDHQKQRKKKEKIRDIYEDATEDSLPPATPSPLSCPPRPPHHHPPPPTPIGFQSLLTKSNKSKRVHSVTTAAQPPPPPPPISIFAYIFKTGSKSKRSQFSSATSQTLSPPSSTIFGNIFSSGSKSKQFQDSSTSSHPPSPPHPSLPTSSILNTSFEDLYKSGRSKNSHPPNPPPPPPPPPPLETHHPINTGKPPKPPKPSTSRNEIDIFVPPLPLITMPPHPPPPPPPFRMPEKQFVAERENVGKHSTNTTRRGAADIDAMLVESEGGDSLRPPFSCPSPDVNTKADTFISRLRGKWRMEKLNSINERHNLVTTSTRSES